MSNSRVADFDFEGRNLPTPDIDNYWLQEND